MATLDLRRRAGFWDFVDWWANHSLETTWAEYKEMEGLR